MKLKLELTLPELFIIRSSVGSLLDITEEELDDPSNQYDLKISRTKLLNDHAILDNILIKIAKLVNHKLHETL